MGGSGIGTTDDIDKKFDSALRNRMQSSLQLAEILRRVRSDARMRSLFRRLRDDDGLRSLLLLSRNDLFASTDEIPILYLHLSRLTTKKTQSSTPSAGLARLIDNRLDSPLAGLPRSGLNLLKEATCASDKEWDRLAGDMKDVFAYGFILFLRENPSLVPLIQSPDFDFKRMKETLGDYSSLKFEVLKGGATLGDLVIDPVVEGKLQRVLEAMTEAFTRNLETVLERTHDALPSLLMPVHLTSQVLIQNVLQKSGLKHAAYVSALDEMYASGAITNASTILWCEQCSLEKLSYSQHIGPIAPSKLERSRCLNCERVYSFAALYSLSPLLREVILVKDGSLSVYVGCALEEAQKAYMTGVYAGDHECDFLVEESWLVECKMHKANRDAEASEKTLHSALLQLRKQVDALEESGRKITRATLVVNRIGLASDRLDRLLSKHDDFVRAYDVEIVDPDEFNDLLAADGE